MKAETYVKRLIDRRIQTHGVYQPTVMKEIALQAFLIGKRVTRQRINRNVVKGYRKGEKDLIPIVKNIYK